MFSKAALFVAATMAAFVAASPIPDAAGQCNTGSIQCCQQVHDSKSNAATAILSLLGIDASNITGQVGLTCSPITGVGIGGGAKCTQAPMCCSNNHYNGLVVVGCTPINISL